MVTTAATVVPTADAPPWAAHAATLLELAAGAIRHGLVHEHPPSAPTNLPAELNERRASFVTLEKKGELRGCIGTIFAHRALAADVVENAFAAAFRDHRFAPFGGEEWEATSVSISVLGLLEPIAADTRAAVLSALRPHHDGLVLSLGRQRGVFLPQVWDKLPQPNDFVAALLRKAGLDSENWPKGLDAQVFHVHETESIPLARIA